MRVVSGVQSVAVNPNEWNGGSMPIIVSAGPKRSTSENASMLLTTLCCESITPFGSPVAPLVNITVARSSIVPRRISRRSATAFGVIAARSQHSARSRTRHPAHHVLEIDVSGRSGSPSAAGARAR